MVDAFIKFVRRFHCRTTKLCEIIKHLKSYFSTYSKPVRIISDRNTAFISSEFKDFMSLRNILHILIATDNPRANRQVEHVNRIISPILLKICDKPNKWMRFWIK